MANVGPTGGTNRRVAGGSFVQNMLTIGRVLPLGSIPSVGAHNILSMNHRENILNNVYTSTALFDAYRTEALTVPAFLNQLRAGVIR